MQVELEINTLGELLKFHRKKESLSLREVGERTNIPASIIWRIENDEPAIFWTIIKLMNFYNLSLDLINKLNQKGN